MAKVTVGDLPIIAPPPKSSATKTSKPNITYATPLYYISLATGLSCPINMKEYFAESGKGHKIYSCILIVILVIGNLVSLRGRMQSSYTLLLQTVTITDIMQFFIMFISNIYCIVHVLICGQGYIQRYFDFLKQIDAKLVTTMNLQRRRIIFYTQLFCSHLVLVLICFYDYWTWSLSLGIEVWQYYAFRLYSYYLSLVIVIQICTFATAIKLRFQILNERLFDVSLDWLGNVESTESLTIRDLFLSYKKSSPEVKAIGISLHCCIKMHDLLCDVIGLLNDCYGLTIVLLVCATIINSVIAFNLTLIFSTGAQPASDSNSLHLIMLNVFWAAFFMGMGVAIAVSCDTASKEAWRGATISYKLLACIPVESTIKKDQDTRALLNQFANQIEYRRPGFDACGFFPVNNSMLYAIIGAVSSYIVIIIQFNNSPILVNNKANSTQT